MARLPAFLCSPRGCWGFVEGGEGEERFAVKYLLSDDPGEFLNGASDVEEEGVVSPAADYHDRVAGDAAEVHPHHAGRPDAVGAALGRIEPEDGGPEFADGGLDLRRENLPG